ncbi:MAG: hypothetical protein JXQ76_08020 [Campylobacterales bacterium]|nr:hypothetical protein [Campylobacterales bacterium]
MLYIENFLMLSGDSKRKFFSYLDSLEWRVSHQIVLLNENALIVKFEKDSSEILVAIERFLDTRRGVLIHPIDALHYTPKALIVRFKNGEKKIKIEGKA